MGSNVLQQHPKNCAGLVRIPLVGVFCQFMRTLYSNLPDSWHCVNMFVAF